MIRIMKPAWKMKKAEFVRRFLFLMAASVLGLVCLWASPASAANVSTITNKINNLYDLVLGIFRDNLLRYLNGEPLEHVVDRSIGY